MQAFEDWGRRLQEVYGRTDTYVLSDMAVNYLGYYTDNGQSVVYSIACLFACLFIVSVWTCSWTCEERAQAYTSISIVHQSWTFIWGEIMAWAAPYAQVHEKSKSPLTLKILKGKTFCYPIMIS